MLNLHPFLTHPPTHTDMQWEGPTEAAGARAARVLPACFTLLEACIEALAADTQVCANDGRPGLACRW